MSNLPANVSNLIAGLQNVVNEAQKAGGAFAYLKLTKGGEWLFGADETEVEEGAEWAINPESIQMGFAAWDDGEQLGEEMAGINQPAIIASDLKDVGAPWKRQIAIQMICLHGDHAGVQVVYSTTSVGGVKLLGKVINEIVKRAQVDPVQYVPVVELGKDSYRHKKYGKIYTPEMDIFDWASTEEIRAMIEGAELDAEGEPEPEPEPEPKKTARKPRKTASKAAKKSTPEPTTDDDEPELSTSAEPEEAGESVASKATRRRRRR